MEGDIFYFVMHIFDLVLHIFGLVMDILGLKIIDILLVLKWVFGTVLVLKMGY